MSKQVNTEKAQVRALKADIDYKIKATKQLEETIDGMQSRHWDKVGPLVKDKQVRVRTGVAQHYWTF